MNSGHESPGLAVRAVNESGARRVLISIQRSVVALDAAEVGDLLVRLAQLRARMRPAVPRHLGGLADRPVTTDAAWRLVTHAATGEGVLSLRHHGAGWLSFVMPLPALASLYEALGRIRCLDGRLRSSVLH